MTSEGLTAAVRVAARERIQKLAGALAQLTKAKQRGDQGAIERWLAEGRGRAGGLIPGAH